MGGRFADRSLDGSLIAFLVLIIVDLLAFPTAGTTYRVVELKAAPVSTVRDAKRLYDVSVRLTLRRPQDLEPAPGAASPDASASDPGGVSSGRHGRRRS